jgi:hypothetical protein
VTSNPLRLKPILVAGCTAPWPPKTLPCGRVAGPSQFTMVLPAGATSSPARVKDGFFSSAVRKPLAASSRGRWCCTTPGEARWGRPPATTIVSNEAFSGVTRNALTDPLSRLAAARWRGFRGYAGLITRTCWSRRSAAIPWLAQFARTRVGWNTGLARLFGRHNKCGCKPRKWSGRKTWSRSWATGRVRWAASVEDRGAFA